jgi:putative flippase GtrA
MRLAYSSPMTTTRQLLSFGAVGLVSNALTYALYLALTSEGVGHKTAMTLVFATSVATTYALNRRWTFDHRGSLKHSAQRYVGIYALAYVGNLAALALLVDAANLPHRLVMLALIVATACVMFLLQKFWVFSLP